LSKKWVADFSGATEHLGEQRGSAIALQDLLAQDHCAGRIDLAIERREPDRVVAKMLASGEAKNPFGTMHAGALIWFADITATLCAIGDLETVDDEGRGFPLAIDLHCVLGGNESEGMLTATSTTTKRGKKLIIVRTEVHGETGRLLIDMTTTHLRAE
jgi:acyl-coenzyme A thioesterase PaaI-like protein